MNTDLAIEGQPPPARDEANTVIPRTADPGYFGAMGIPLLRGRVFDQAERLERADKAIVSSSLVREYFSSGDPIGKYVSFWNRRWQIIGIVGDIRKNLDEFPEPTIYVPASSGVLNFAALVIRTTEDPLHLTTSIEQGIARLDPNLAASDVLTMSQLISKRTANRQFALILLISFAGVAVLLTAVGLYGVVSYLTAQRAGEFGVRVALGAQSRDLIQLVVKQGLTPVLIGMAIGLMLAIAAVRAMESMLFEVKPLDTSVFACVALGLLVIAAAASLIPALTAAGVDPAQALRAE
jgi:predicted permease